MDSAMLLPATTSSVDVSLADVCAFLEHGLDDDDGEDSSMELPPGKRLRMDFGVDSSATEVVSSNSSSTMTVPAGPPAALQPWLAQAAIVEGPTSLLHSAGPGVLQWQGDEAPEARGPRGSSKTSSSTSRAAAQGSRQAASGGSGRRGESATGGGGGRAKASSSGGGGGGGGRPAPTIDDVQPEHEGTSDAMA